MFFPFLFLALVTFCLWFWLKIEKAFFINRLLALLSLIWTVNTFNFYSENIYIVTIYKAGKGLFPPQALLSDWQLSLYFAFYTCVGFGWVIKALHCTVHSKSGQVSKHTVVKVCRLANFSEETYHECTLGLI